MRAPTEPRAAVPAQLHEIAALVGGDDALHTAILETGASEGEIMLALARRAGMEDALGEPPPPLEGRAAAVHELLAAFEPASLEEG